MTFLNSNHYSTTRKTARKKENEEILEPLKYFESGLLYFIISIIVNESSTGERTMSKN